MLQSIRDRTQGWITSTVIGLLIIVFALWGIHGYLELNMGNNKVVAKIAGQTLLQSDFDKLYQHAYQQAQDRWGKNFSNNEKMIDHLKKQTLQEWETAQVLFQAALQSKYRISQALINAVLLQIPTFQSAWHFSIEQFYDVLHAINYTKLQFLTDIKKTLLINQVQQGITQSAFALPQDISNYIKYTQQKRDFAYLIIPHVKFLHQQFRVSGSTILAYYLKNKQNFRQPEQASIEYIELSSRSEKTFLENRDKLANLTYIHPDSLAIVANKLGLSVYSTGFFDKAGVKEKLSKNQQMAISEAYQYRENLLKNLEKTGNNPKSFANKNIKWQFIRQVNRYDNKLNKAIVKTVFTLAPPNKNIPISLSMKGFSLENGDYVLVKLFAVHDGKYQPSNSRLDLYREEIAENFGQMDYRLYKRDLLKKAKLIQ